MAGAGTRFPPLYIAACILLGLGAVGLGSIALLRPASHIFSGLLYLSLGCIAFGIGEILNHPKILPPITNQDNTINKLDRQRNSCSLGNLLDIGALLLIFGGLSGLLFPQ